MSSQSTTLTLTPAQMRKVEWLKASRYKPVAIAKLTDEIEGEMRVAVLRASVNKTTVDREHAAKIAEMQRQLDGMYVDWAKGKSVSSPNQE